MTADSMREHAVALRAVDPDEPDCGDLEALRELVGDARVVLLGESTDREVPTDRELLGLADLGARFSAPAHHAAMTARQRSRLSRGLVELVERAARSGDDVAHRCALGAQQLDEQLGDGRFRREELMADTVHWILEREERVVISAHNAHVQRGHLVNGATALGAHLAPLLGERMVVIGTTRATGSVPELHRGDAGQLSLTFARSDPVLSVAASDAGIAPRSTVDGSVAVVRMSGRDGRTTVGALEFAADLLGQAVSSVKRVSGSRFMPRPRS